MVSNSNSDVRMKRSLFNCLAWRLNVLYTRLHRVCHNIDQKKWLSEKIIVSLHDKQHDCRRS
jgi:hypothetical protein